MLKKIGDNMNDHGQIYMNSWFGFIILLIIILVILRVFGLI